MKLFNNPSTPDEDTIQVSEHEHGFCWDSTCPCKESRELVGELNDQVQNGLASTDDANRIYKGKVV